MMMSPFRRLNNTTVLLWQWLWISRSCYVTCWCYYVPGAAGPNLTVVSSFLRRRRTSCCNTAAQGDFHQYVLINSKAEKVWDSQTLSPVSQIVALSQVIDALHDLGRYMKLYFCAVCKYSVDQSNKGRYSSSSHLDFIKVHEKEEEARSIRRKAWCAVKSQISEV